MLSLFFPGTYIKLIIILTYSIKDTRDRKKKHVLNILNHSQSKTVSSKHAKHGTIQ